ncbi:hypothetical protein EHYA_09614 [Embleya hyalina]|uniref:Uncharacterized protein n=1 Tax=Embleya hyalina TaxID=516124 RepID=A0A401Z4R7_9ACTN|nr:hypothetical protein EHYA_09614 [Embleya hyalina]
MPVHEPFVEQVLQPGDAETRLTPGVCAASAGVGAGVPGKVSAERGVDRPEGALDDALGRRRVRRGGLHADPERLARGGERPRQEDPSPVHDDGLRYDDRPGGSAPEVFVQRHRPIAGEQPGAGEAQHVGPCRPGGTGDGRLCGRRRRVHRPGLARLRHRRRDCPGPSFRFLDTSAVHDPGAWGRITAPTGAFPLPGAPGIAPDRPSVRHLRPWRWTVRYGEKSCRGRRHAQQAGSRYESALGISRRGCPVDLPASAAAREGRGPPVPRRTARGPTTIRTPSETGDHRLGFPERPFRTPSTSPRP